MRSPQLSRRDALQAAAGLAVAGAGLGACASDPEPKAMVGELEKAQLTVGVLPIPDIAPLYIAINRGFFQEEGLTIKPKIIKGTTPEMPNLISGKTDIVLANYVSYMQVQSQGAVNVKVVADMYQAEANCFTIMVDGKSKIKDVKGLKGAKISITTRNSIATLAVESALIGHAMTADDVEYVEMPFPQVPDALKAGKIDAGWLVEPFISAVEVNGGRIVADTMAAYTDRFPIAGWGCTADWAAKHPNALQAFQRAHLKAQKIAASDRQAVTKVIPTYTKIPENVASSITLGSFPVSVNEARLQRVIDAMVEFGYLKNPNFTGKDLMLNSYPD